MFIKRNVNEMVKNELPEKGNRRNQAIDHTGLHKRPQMEEIVNYLANDQESTKFPDREAKFIRNHPFMTQLDFFCMLYCKKIRKEHGKSKSDSKKQSD